MYRPDEQTLALRVTRIFLRAQAAGNCHPVKLLQGESFGVWFSGNLSLVVWRLRELALHEEELKVKISHSPRRQTAMNYGGSIFCFPRGMVIPLAEINWRTIGLAS